MLLILTSETDLTADFLIVELEKRKLPYFRLNSEELASADYRFELDAHKICREIALRSKVLNLSEISAVWYRRAIHPTPIQLPPGERAFVAGELRHLATGLVLNPGVLWMNPIDRVSIAEHKLFQLQAARAVNLRVPRTLVSKDHRQLTDFVASNSSGTICKPIFHGMFIDHGDRYSVYTRRVTEDDFRAGTAEDCPILLQEELARVADVRATFIGEHCFVADVTSEMPLIDWRDPDVSVRFARSCLPSEIESKCRLLLARLGLTYGAFDFIRTPDGDLVFLEVNPTGEWAWLEDALGLPMRDAFIDCFFGT